jgi:chromosome segregation ATPase
MATYTDDPAVVSARQDLIAKRAEVESGEQTVETLKDELEALRTDLARVKAEEEIGDATQTDVDNAQTAVDDKEAELATAQDELAVDRDAVVLLEGKLRTATVDAKVALQTTLESEYSTKLQTAVDAIDSARTAVQDLASTGTELDALVRADNRPKPFIYSDDDVKIVSNASGVRYPGANDDFLARAARAGVTPS